MTDPRQTADPEICAQWDWCPYCKNGLDTGLQCDQCLADLMPVQEALRELQRLRSSGGASERPCTCHPDDNPPTPCPRKYALQECRAAAEPSERQPDGYAYRYPDGYIRFSGGREVNGSDPVETIPYYFRRAPEPGEQYESGWVIEGAWSPTDQPEYWVGSSTWSTDPYKALRFANQQSAQQAADLMCDGLNVRICEHEWACSTLTKDDKP